MRVWSTADEADEEDEDLPENSADADTSAYLTSEPGSITASTPKWRYVEQAMLLAPGQFHDHHADYSREVQLKLDAVAANLARQYRAREKLSSPCPKCLKTRQKWAEKGYPPPADLVARLDGLSSRFRQYVNGSAWAWNLYTSKWCKAYMQARAPCRCLCLEGKPLEVGDSVLLLPAGAAGPAGVLGRIGPYLEPQPQAATATLAYAKAIENADSWGYFALDLAGYLSAGHRTKVLY
ncbi:hypothetical protein [Azoarcus indigens]|uniref:Uncharacterized protein n=1 Tax=Azoarcus indigens TaxID=29545 RepID=A0A4R6DJQ2_9RHOO|nr:hypothetical protein [Azoarcus indigens]TDN45036.1 hypothetical protein C7389_1316 [Azoarcus indigens]